MHGVKGATSKLNVEFVLREKVKSKFDRLESKVIVEPVQNSDSAAPIVPVMKHNSTTQICGKISLYIYNLSSQLSPIHRQKIPWHWKTARSVAVFTLIMLGPFLNGP